LASAEFHIRGPLIRPEKALRFAPAPATPVADPQFVRNLVLHHCVIVETLTLPSIFEGDALLQGLLFDSVSEKMLWGHPCHK